MSDPCDTRQWQTIHSAQAMCCCRRNVDIVSEDERFSNKASSRRECRLTPRSVTTREKNPFIVQATDGKEAPTTKFTIGNIPLTHGNDEREGTFVKLSCKPRSKMLMERDRDKVGGGGGLTRWLTGRRFLCIEVPSHPFPSRLQIGPYKATLYHFGQPAARQ